jgi:hypothetical protein
LRLLVVRNWQVLRFQSVGCSMMRCHEIPWEKYKRIYSEIIIKTALLRSNEESRVVIPALVFLLPAFTHLKMSANDLSDLGA